MRIGIDATNLGGGGGVTHLKEILACIDKSSPLNKNQRIYVFSSAKVLDQIQNSDTMKPLNQKKQKGK